MVRVGQIVEKYIKVTKKVELVLPKLTDWLGYEDLEDQRESMRKQFSRLIEYLQVLPVSLTYIDYVEADDIIAYLANHYFKKEVTIISSDKDFLQLVNPRIKVWAPTKRKCMMRTS